MRIAQLTFDGYFNYGSILQKFALHHTLKKLADFTEVLWTMDRPLFSETGLRAGAQCVVNKARKNWEKIFHLREAVRQSKFKDFENLHIKTRFDVTDFENIADEYDFFVVGSGQVWNPKWYPPHIFLNFVPREKKLAYSVGIGVSAIPASKKKIFQDGISNFNYVSVCEEESVKLINDLTGQSALVLPDPVLLLTEEEWLAVAQKPTWFKEKYSNGYILTYYLSKLPPPEIKKLADELGLPVINLLDTENYDHFTVGPAEFIWLFANASLIFTNSFHGVAFSILFKRPFLNYELSANKLVVPSTGRTATLLNLFGLEDRAQMLDEPLKIDFARRDEVLPVEREKAFKFLAKGLYSQDDEAIRKEIGKDFRKTYQELLAQIRQQFEKSILVVTAPLNDVEQKKLEDFFEHGFPTSGIYFLTVDEAGQLTCKETFSSSIFKFKDAAELSDFAKNFKIAQVCTENPLNWKSDVFINWLTRSGLPIRTFALNPES